MDLILEGCNPVAPDSPFLVNQDFAVRIFFVSLASLKNGFAHDKTPDFDFVFELHH
jgi:hypothetical protein